MFQMNFDLSLRGDYSAFVLDAQLEDLKVSKSIFIIEALSHRYNLVCFSCSVYKVELCRTIYDVTCMLHMADSALVVLVSLQVVHLGPAGTLQRLARAPSCLSP